MLRRKKRAARYGDFILENSPDFDSVEKEFSSHNAEVAVQAAALLNGKEMTSCSLDPLRGTFSVASSEYQATIATADTSAAENILSMLAIGKTTIRSHESNGKLVITAACGEWLYRVRGLVSSASFVS